MKLSELPDSLGLAVFRDAEFGNLGFLFDDLPGKLIFVEGSRFVREARRAKGVCAVLVTGELAPSFADVPGLAVCAEPRLGFFRLQHFLVTATAFYGESAATEIDPSAIIHPRAWVASRNVVIGASAVIDANVSIEEHTRIGAGVRVRAGAVLGSEGFQTAHCHDTLIQMAHGGGLTIGDGAEIFSNAVIARGLFRQSTMIGEGSRVGNGAFVSHNVQVGRRCFIGHGAVVNGNTTIGDDAWIGPNATIANQLSIGERARVTLGATVIQSVHAGEHVTGMTAVEHRRMLRHIASIR